MSPTSGVILRCSSGDRFLAGSFDDSIRGILLMHRVPITSVHLLVEDRSGVSLGPVSEFARIGEIPRGSVVVAYMTRNYDPLELSKFETGAPLSSGWTTEWSFCDESDPTRSVTRQLTPRHVLDLAVEACNGVFKSGARDPLAGSPIVIGFSGGGDSNLLLKALTCCPETRGCEIQPVFVCGIDDWDRQLPHARHVASELGFVLRVVESAEAARHSGLDGLKQAKQRFAEVFPNVGVDFFGTWLLRKVLSGVADQQSSGVVALGYNREDVLAEALLRVSNGMLPLPFPWRQLGTIRFVYPLFQMPKKIIDGMFPFESVSNYRNRNPSPDTGRALFYHACQILSSSMPGFDAALLIGLQRLACDSGVSWDPDLGDYVAGDASIDLKEKWSHVIGSRLRQVPV